MDVESRTRGGDLSRADPAAAVAVLPRRYRRSLAAWLLGGGVLLAFYAPLLSPRVALGNRDVPLFHLPLRSDLMRLATEGVPSWNPFIHGGQPVLSNPNYAAFYPPTWVALGVGPVYSFNLLVLLHAAVAFAGAWTLARRLGCGFAAAALTAVGFMAGGGFVSLTSSFNFFCGMAWFPWVLAAAEAVLAPAAAGRWHLAALGGGTALALQLLAGEPVSVLISGFVLAGMALGALRRPRVVARLALPLLVAAGLSAVQWLPTWQRLADSPRSGPLPLEVATAWSTPPGRLVELIFPRIWGDPTRVEEGFYLGWHLHDQGYPYVVSIYPGLLVALLGLGALVLRPIPRRAAWVTASLVGLSLALGRHDPLYPMIHDHVPVLGLLRYPEKFLLAPLACLPFAAGLGWQRLLEGRRRGRTGEADFPLALGLGVLAVALGMAALTLLRPAVEGFLRAGSVPPPGPEVLQRGVAFLRQGAVAAVLTAAAVVVLLFLCRWRRVPETVVTMLAVALLAGDLWGYGHRLPRTVPAALLRQPPPLAREILAHGQRVFTGISSDPRPELVLRDNDADRQQLANALARLDPYSGNLWGIAYAFHEDYDLMLTAPAARSARILVRDWSSRPRALRLLGAWNVGSLIFSRPLEQRLASWAEGHRLAPVEVKANPFVLPRYRFVPQVRLYPDAGAALAAAREQEYDLNRMDHWVSPGDALARLGPTPRPRMLALEELGGRLEVHYRSDGIGLFVAAVSWDRGWRASVDGEVVPIHLTAVGQMGLAVPAGDHRLVLEYRDPWVGRGGAISGSALLLGLLAVTLPPMRRFRRGRATIPPAP